MKCLLNRYFKYLCATILCFGILFIAYWIRIQNVTNIPDGQFTENDAYLHYWQAQLISENGKLPARDFHRWMPMGRDFGQSLNFYSYALAYSHKAISLFFPNISLYQVTLYAPAICYTLGLGVLCLYLYSTFGCLLSSIVGIILATLPGTIIRSAAGFSDRDSWCLLLGILAITTYLTSLQTRSIRKCLLWTLVSGISVLFGGLSWEGFGVFVSVILFVELWRFLTSEAEDGLNFYLLWVLTFVPTLYFASPAYRSGQGHTTHLAAVVLLPPMFLFMLRMLRFFLTTKTSYAKKLYPHARLLALVLTLVSFIGILGYVLVQLKTFSSTPIPLGQNRLMQTLSELKAPDYSYWVYLYGNIFSLGSVGVILIAIHNWKKIGTAFAVPLALFVIATFGREHLDVGIGTNFSNIFYFTAIACCVIGFLFVAWKRNKQTENELIYVAFTAWFLLWGALSRDTLRFDFYLGPALAFFTAAFIHFLSNIISEKLSHPAPENKTLNQHIPHSVLKIGISVLLLVPLLFWTPAAHTKRTLYVAKQLRKPTPGETPIAKTFHWMKSELPDTAVVAASWIYGSQLNVLGGVKTIIDQDHYLQHWIYLYNRYVFCNPNNDEALEFLKTHNATHIMLTQHNILNSDVHAFVGNHKNSEQFKPISLQISTNKAKIPQRLLTSQHTPFRYIDVIDWNATTPDFLNARLKNGQTTTLPYVALFSKQRKTSPTQKVGNQHGGVVFYFDEQQHLEKAYYLPAAGWHSLAIRLYFLGDLPNIFIPVYPTDKETTADVKIWKIRYPSGIKENLKYLEIESAE